MALATPSQGLSVAAAIVLGWLLLSSIALHAASPRLSVRLIWDPNQEEDLAGYRLHYGLESGNYIRRIDIGVTNRTTVDLPIPARTYYFAVTAYDTEGLESAYSNEVTYQAPDAEFPIEASLKEDTMPEDGRYPLDLGLPPGLPLPQWLLTESPKHGRVETQDNQLVYRPSPDFAGEDQFEIVTGLDLPVALRQTWRLRVLEENDPPFAFDSWISTERETPVTFDLEGYDPEGLALGFSLLDRPNSGTLSGEPPRLTYTPRAGFVGSDSLSFLVSDGVSTSLVARVEIEVADAEFFPLIRDMFVTGFEDQPLAFLLEVDTLRAVEIRNIDPPDFGSLHGTAPDLTYLAVPNFFGTDTAVFEVSDAVGNTDIAVVFFEVQSVNDPPVAAPQELPTPYQTALAFQLIGTDPDEDFLHFELSTCPTKGVLSGIDCPSDVHRNPTSPLLTYIPHAGSSGLDSFTFRVFDGTTYSEASTVRILIQPAPLPAPMVTANVTAQGQLRLTWDILPGRSYRVMFRNSLDSQDWQPVSDILISEADTLEWITEVHDLPVSGFYAVILLPP